MKLPELLLDQEYEFDENFVLSEIKKYDFRNKNVFEDKSFEVCRVGGYNYKAEEDGSCEMIGWQCNFASIQNYDIQLPTIITLKVNSDNKIEKIHLNESFKGSQGIPCSQKYLARRLMKFEGEEFSQKNEVLCNDLGTGCRHTFEVLFGACVFREWCKANNLNTARLSESTASFHRDGEIVAVDKNSVNGNEVVSEIHVSDFKETIKYDYNGAICGCNEMKLNGFIRMGNEMKPIEQTKRITAETKTDFSLKLLKILSKYWMRSGKEIGIKNRFYFSHLWPTTLYGILVQMFAVVVYSDSYSYFQHCIRGLQKDNKHCACIGVCEDINECMRYFPDFKLDDLF